MKRSTTWRHGIGLIGALVVLVALAVPSVASTRIMCLGDSITHGHLGHASYRYFLWFDLIETGYNVDFVGQQDDIYGGPPDPELYPQYHDTFDRDHEGHWGYRTENILDLLPGALDETEPDVVLIHLGTNDVGQLGNTGIVLANENLRIIIGQIRAANPEAVILLAQIIPISPESFYGPNAHLIDQFNNMVSRIVHDLTTEPSPVVLVDQHHGYDLATMMQPDGLHPNLEGERFMAERWAFALDPVLRPDVIAVDPVPAAALELAAYPNPFNPRLTVSFRVPEAATGPVSVLLLDAGGRLVRTLASGVPMTAGPHRLDWDGRDERGQAVPSGVYLVRASAGAQRGLTRVSLVR